jgi:hypothetical protein
MTDQGDPCILPSRKADARRLLQPDLKRAAEVTVEALMHSLWQRGVCALDEPNTRRRISELDAAQADACGERLLNPKLAKAWPADDVEIFVRLHGELR